MEMMASNADNPERRAHQGNDALVPRATHHQRVAEQSYSS
jgi:hypothetical protein